MDTMLDVRAAAAAVPGARHLRLGRNGQDAAAAWVGEGGAVVVVCDGCSAGAHSEVGARLGASLVVAAAARELGRGVRAAELWPAVEAHVLGALGALAAAMPGELAQLVREHFLFTIVAAAVDREAVAVWAHGDGAYALGGHARVLGPFADNQPPYLAYALLGEAPRAHLELADPRCGSVLVATDGIAEAADWLAAFAAPAPLVRHPDALRRLLALRARGDDRIDWDGRRVERRAAVLQDDGAVALARWAVPA